ncbi:MAG TPA: hypothetical protein DD727_00670 [Clostridiales bacterium]|nr:hypothetical protein [Clostridiales bacterium]
MPGVDVVSPTWLELMDISGNVKVKIDPGYITWARSRGYQIWALLANDFKNPEKTRQFLHDPNARDELIRQVLAVSALYGLDGINIDFENVYKADRDALSQFVRELTPFLHAQGLIVSMDVNIPEGSENWSQCYDHQALGRIVDYLVLMTYDQYYASGNKAGSVAEITWVEENALKVLEMVPRQKLLLGVPFYTRVWDDRDKHIGVIGMDRMQEILQEYPVHKVWDSQSGQYKITYEKDGSTRIFWMEDLQSMDLKSALVLKLDLAGIASWNRADGTEAVWPLLNRNLKLLQGYMQWSPIMEDAGPGEVRE